MKKELIEYYEDQIQLLVVEIDLAITNKEIQELKEEIERWDCSLNKQII
jgi:lipid II:glycine glycyltransferase (peptidoglycan interpeptide bridge formation enzyme)